MKKIIVSLSGGMDSTTLFTAACASGAEVLPVTILYGSKHNLIEIEHAYKVSLHYGKRGLHVLNLRSAFESFKSTLLHHETPVPEGHYEEESMRATVVPFRNGIIASCLVGLAESLGYDEVWMGVHAGDHFIYPDCRPEFVQSFATAALRGTNFKVRFRAPFLYLDKHKILRYGTGEMMKDWGSDLPDRLTDPVPYHLTRTCYTDSPVACGRCGACQERLEAFALLGRPDPLDYQSRELLPKKGA